MTSADIENGLLLKPGATWRCGDWRDVLADVECDVMISDPPYSARVHRAGALIEGADDAERSVEIGYEPLTEEDAEQFCQSWSPRVKGWMCIHTSHDLVPTFERELGRLGRYVFPPVPCVMRGMSVRLQGDGPSNWTVYLVVARRKHRHANKWGTLPGAYFGPPPSRASVRGKSIVVGQKPQWMINAIVRDYSRAGDLVCDPYSGAGTTAIACESLGRRFVGAELNPKTHAKAIKRIANGVQLDMFGGMQ